VYSVKTDSETFSLTSKDFQGLTILTFVPENDGEVGCSSDLSKSTIVITYREAAGQNAPMRGELVALEFVPDDFRLVDLKAEPDSPTYVVEDTGPAPVEGEMAEQRRNMMMQGIRDALSKPADGETQDLGFIERAECTKDGMFFFIKTSSQTLRLAGPKQPLKMRAFTPDIESLQIGCGMKSVEVPIVFVDRTLGRSKMNGKIFLEAVGVVWRLRGEALLRKI
jgi:hypothetical protein